MGRPSQTGRERIPQQHRSLLRTNVRFDRRDQEDMELLRFLSDPDRRARRIHELLLLGMKAHNAMRDFKRADRISKDND